MPYDVQANRNGDSARPETHSQAAQPTRVRSSRLPIVLAGGVLFVIAAVVLALIPHLTSSGTASTGTPTATPMPRVLYQANWAQGTDGWTLPAHWHLTHGQINNDGIGNQANPLLIPYAVTGPDFSVTVDFTVTKVPNTANSHTYGIEGLDRTGTQQFFGGVCCIRQGIANAGFSEISVAHADSANDSLTEADYTVSHYTVTFVVQVHDHNLGFCPGYSCLSNLNSTTPLWPVQLAIYDVGIQLSVSRVVVTSP